jgi:hypothetical protein
MKKCCMSTKYPLTSRGHRLARRFSIKTHSIAITGSWWLAVVLLACMGLLAEIEMAKAWEAIDYDLMWAVRRGDMAGVKAALAKGADVNEIEKMDRTPLM